jgi:alkylation response protein AidB-like acyl-CoA dehydrogenase
MLSIRPISKCFFASCDSRKDDIHPCYDRLYSGTWRVGLVKGYSIERMLRNAKTIQNLEGTNLIQKALIAKKSSHNYLQN